MQSDRFKKEFRKRLDEKKNAKKIKPPNPPYDDFYVAGLIALNKITRGERWMIK